MIYRNASDSEARFNVRVDVRVKSKGVTVRFTLRVTFRVTNSVLRVIPGHSPAPMPYASGHLPLTFASGMQKIKEIKKIFHSCFHPILPR